jgi:hypothetical protein
MFRRRCRHSVFHALRMHFIYQINSKSCYILYSTHATTGVPQRMNGPTVLMTTLAFWTAASTCSGLVTSTRITSTDVSRESSEISSSSFDFDRAPIANVNLDPRSACAYKYRVTKRPVNPTKKCVIGVLLCKYVELTCCTQYKYVRHCRGQEAEDSARTS